MTTAPEQERRLPRFFYPLLAFGVLALAGLVLAGVLVATSNSSRLTDKVGSQLLTYRAGHQPLAATATLRRLGGGPDVSVGGAVGHPTVVNFWASWCTACQQELAAVAAVAREHVVPFIGVDTNDTSASQALALLHKVGATYPVGEDNASLALKYNAPGLPTTAFVNAKGRIVAVYLGAITKTALNRFVHELSRGEAISTK